MECLGKCGKKCVPGSISCKTRVANAINSALTPVFILTSVPCLFFEIWNFLVCCYSRHLFVVSLVSTPVLLSPKSPDVLVQLISRLVWDWLKPTRYPVSLVTGIDSEMGTWSSQNHRDMMRYWLQGKNNFLIFWDSHQKKLTCFGRWGVRCEGPNLCSHSQLLEGSPGLPEEHLSSLRIDLT